MSLSSFFKAFFSDDKNFITSLKNLTGFFPGNISVYKLAFSHRSIAREGPNGIKISNERLEYLGDAVLGAVVADLLFKKFPYRDEGFLTEMRSRIVSRENLKQLAFKLGIDQMVKNNASGPEAYRSMYGDALEALIGAIYIDKGYNKARNFILLRMIEHHTDLDALEKADKNFKSKILNWGQRNKRNVTFEEDENFDDAKLIKVRLLIDSEEIAEGIDFVKKKAEQIAAQKACEKLSI